MKEICKKGKCNQDYILLSGVLLEVELMLKDYYVAKITREDNNIIIGFSNGQNFIVNIVEKTE